MKIVKTRLRNIILCDKTLDEAMRVRSIEGPETLI